MNPIRYLSRKDKMPDLNHSDWHTGNWRGLMTDCFIAVAPLSLQSSIAWQGPARGLRRPEGGHQARRQFFRLLGAVIDRHAAIGIAGEKQTRIVSGPRLDGRHALQMADEILRNRMIPADNALKDRRRDYPHGNTQFGAHRAHQAFIVP